MLASIFTSVLQNRSFLSWKICFFTKICICLQNVILFAKINSIFVTNLNNKLQRLRWKFSSIALSTYKCLILFFTFFKSISLRFQQHIDVYECTMCVHWQERREEGGKLGKMKSELLCSGPAQYPQCQTQEEMKGRKG